MSEWRALRALIEGGGLARLRRLVVLAQTPSTQDAARELDPDAGGVAVIAETQTAGRGRLGRTWEQHGGLAVTFALDPDMCAAPGVLPLAAGVAAAEAAEDSSGATLALRWPNDVVTVGAGLKLAGVLIERTRGRVLIGIGMNVVAAPARAASLRALGSSASRGEVAVSLARRLDAALALEAPEVIARWRARDCLEGTSRTFEHDGRRLTGVVLAVDPAASITVRDGCGVLHRLPAAGTSLVP